MTQYSLVVQERLHGCRRFRAYDRSERCVVFEWQGRMTHSPFVPDRIPRELVEPGVHVCSKATLRHLILAATAAQLVHEESCSTRGVTKHPWEAAANERLSRRAGEINCWPRGVHRTVALALFAHEEAHLRAADVLVLLLADGFFVCLPQVQACLSDLVAAGLIQSIVVKPGFEFYDTNTRPHPHIYDPDTDSLWDIHPRGVLQLGTDQLEAAIAGPA